MCVSIYFERGGFQSQMQMPRLMMPGRFETSRRLFERSKDDAKSQGEGHHSKKPQATERSARELIFSFLTLLRPHRVPVIASLATATLATGLALIPPAATKFVVAALFTNLPNALTLAGEPPIDTVAATSPRPNDEAGTTPGS